MVTVLISPMKVFFKLCNDKVLRTLLIPGILILPWASKPQRAGLAPPSEFPAGGGGMGALRVRIFNWLAIP